MITKVLLAILCSISFLNAQTTCNYVETKLLSLGYNCLGESLIFTTSVNTEVRGRISAGNEILIIPAENNGITILPSADCQWCTDPTNNSGVETKKNGGGKGKKNLYTTDSNNKELIIEKNPVDILLKLSLNSGIIKEIIIFDKTGKQVKHKYNIYKTAEIDVSSLPNGVYGVKTITGNNQTFKKQFIKN